MSVGLRRLVAALVVGAALGGQVLLAGAAPSPKPPPPTPVDGRLSPFQSTLATPHDGIARPLVAAEAAVLSDLGRGTILLEKASDQPRPVASLTKVMAALITLEQTEPADVVVVDRAAVFEPEDYGYGSTLRLREGERITVEDLLYGLILSSANDAAVALAVHVAGSEEAFVQTMNSRARELGMADTRFRSPNGLDDRGVSTASDLLRLVRTVDAMPEFREIASAKFHTISSSGKRERRVQNRNVLLWLYEGADGVKTGFTYRAGYCLIATAERDGRRLAVVVLDAPREAFSTAAALLNHGFEGFEERTLVTQGEDRGVVGLTGGSVPVMAGSDLSALVAAADAGEVRTRTVVAASAAFPPAPGQRVGTLVVTIDGKRAGWVPLVAASVPGPVAEEGPWWLRALSSVAGAVVSFVSGLAG